MDISGMVNVPGIGKRPLTRGLLHKGYLLTYFLMARGPTSAP